MTGVTPRGAPAAGDRSYSLIGSSPTSLEIEMLFGQEHVKRYRATDGAEGHDWRGTSVLLLSTTGRRTGQEQTTPLIYGQSGDDYVVVASKGGAPEHPAWFLNLSDDPEVKVQVYGDRFAAHARPATGQERQDLWKMMAARWPAYDNYQAKTDREIPVVVLSRN
jgi:deazaflavin-dependent oxidoreductase (nitroreductase family)